MYLSAIFYLNVNRWYNWYRILSLLQCITCTLECKSWTCNMERHSLFQTTLALFQLVERSNCMKVYIYMNNWSSWYWSSWELFCSAQCVMYDIEIIQLQKGSLLSIRVFWGNFINLFTQDIFYCIVQMGLLFIKANLGQGDFQKSWRFQYFKNKK